MALVAALTLSACTTQAPTPGACESTDVEEVGANLGLSGPAVVVTAHDDYFDPACLRLSESGPITVVVRNEGRYPHDLTLPDGSGVRVDGGQTALLDTRMQAGQVPFVCTIHPGMDGEFEVSGT